MTIQLLFIILVFYSVSVLNKDAPMIICLGDHFTDPQIASHNYFLCRFQEVFIYIFIYIYLTLIYIYTHIYENLKIHIYENLKVCLSMIQKVKDGFYNDTFSILLHALLCNYYIASKQRKTTFYKKKKKNPGQSSLSNQVSRAG